MADEPTLANILAGDDPYGYGNPTQTEANALSRSQQPDPSMSLDGEPKRSFPESIWGRPKTASDDYFYYLPESMVGDLAYRYQGAALHGGMAVLPGANWGLLARLLNAAYAGGTVALGRTAPTHRVEGQTPELSYRPNLPLFGESNPK